jgi:hypothetical protein
MRKFSLGQVVWTAGINHTISENEQFTKEVLKALKQYVNGDWGILDKHDKKLNDDAVKYNNDRILAKYNTCEGSIYIITEYDRSVTTILFPSEY